MTNKDRLVKIARPFASDSACEQENRTCEFKDCKTCNAECIVSTLLDNGIILPLYKVGDTVYTYYDHLFHKETNEILECKVVFIGLGKDGNYINIVDNYGHLHSMSFEIFDKTVFLNQEEAEKELERSKENVRNTI